MAKSRGMQNVAVTYNGTNITQYLNKASAKAVVNAIDTTNFASTGVENTAGVPSWTVDVGGMWDLALDSVLGVDAITPPSATLRTLVVSYGPTGGKVTWTWTGSSTVGAFITDYNVDASNPTDMLGWSGTLTCSGVPTRTTG